MRSAVHTGGDASWQHSAARSSGCARAESLQPELRAPTARHDVSPPVRISLHGPRCCCAPFYIGGLIYTRLVRTRRLEKLEVGGFSLI